MLIIVTGASRGIGLELVKRFAGKRGVLVLAVSRDISVYRKLRSHQVMPVSADITSGKDLRRLVKLVQKLDHPVSVIVNNAGLLVKRKFEEITTEDLHKVYHTNVFAPYLLVQAMLPYFSKKPHIVNISSMGGVQGSLKFPGLSAYSSSKAALCSITECLAEELGSRGISVNCLALGAVQTEMLEAAFPGYKAPLDANRVARFIADFALKGNRYFNGKILPVSLSTP